MGDDGYRVLFDARDHWPALWFALPGFLFIAITWAIWRNRARPAGWYWPLDTRPRLRALSSGYMLVFSIFWTGAVVLGTTWNYARARYLLASGEAKVVEGVVSNFSPGAKTERFDLGGVTFKYSRYEITSAHNELSGAFGNGSRLRVHYQPRGGDPAILKLELSEGAVCR